MYAIQLDLFKTQEQCEIDTLRIELAKVKGSLDKVRKGTYARLNENGKGLLDHEERLAIVERFICHS